MTQTLAGDKKGSDGDSDNSSVDLEEVDDAVESHPPPEDDTDDEEDDSNKLSESDALENDVGTDVNFEEEAVVARKVLKNLLASSKGSIASPDGETKESDKSKLKNSSTKPVVDSSGVSEPLKPGKPKEVAPKETQENDDFERTLFIRNLPFDVTKEEVKQRFAVFGEVESLFLVLHKVTKYVSLHALKFIQSLKKTSIINPSFTFSLCVFFLRRPEGTAFLKFKTADASVAAISAANTASGVGVLLKGRQLNVMRAVGKKAAKDIELKKTEEKNVDLRNLYLAKVHTFPSPHKSLEIVLSACFSNTH